MTLNRSNRGSGLSTSNRFLTPDALSNDSLYRLKNQQLFARLARHNYEKIFEDHLTDGKVSVKKPFKAFITEGRVMGDASYNFMRDETVEIDVDKRYHGAFRFSDEERALTIKDFGDQYLQAMVEEFAQTYDETGAKELATNIYQYVTHGAITAFDSVQAQHARSYFTEMSIPQSRTNYAILNPADFANIAEDLKTMDVPQMIGQSAIRERYRGMLSNFHVFESNNIPVYESVSKAQTAGKPQVKTAVSSSTAADTLVTYNWTSSTKIKAGTLITIADCNQVKARGEKAETGRQQPFVVTQDVTSHATSTSNTTLKVYPEMNDGTRAINGITSKAYKNISAYPAANKVITVVGTAGKKHSQQLFWDRDALEYAQVILTPPESATRKGYSFDPDSGASITFTEDFDIKQMVTMLRCDLFFGVKCIYPEVAVRNIGEAIN